MKASIDIKAGGVAGRLLQVAGLLILLALITFCVFYLCSGYEQLVKWYTGLNDCFYRAGDWSRTFFTPHIKNHGNMYCIAAIIAAGACCIYLFKQLRKPLQKPVLISIAVYDVVCVLICIAATVALWVWGTSLVAASNDEVFSAVNCAGLHPLQTLSYYMLPNNHIFFNLVNNILFHGAADKVATGRIISLVCYSSIIVVVFFWLRHLFNSRWLALLIALTMALQFPTFGFGTQARGYELLTLAAWVAFISFYWYLQAREMKWMKVFIAACAVGYFCVPTFLYFHAAVLLFAFVCQLVGKRFDRQFWLSQLMTVVIVFLLYTPAFAFSGYSAIAGNAYVKGQQLSELWQQLWPVFQNYLDYSFFSVLTSNHEVDVVLFLLPLCLLFYRKNKTAQMLGGFYLAMWAACLLITLKTKMLPIDRALTAQFSILLAIVIYTVFLLKRSFGELVKIKGLPHIVLPVFLFLLGYNYVQKDKQHVNHYLCHFQVNGWYELIGDGVYSIPPRSSVAFSEESYYWYYYCRQNGYNALRCRPENANYYIKAGWEQFPPGMESNYKPLKQVGDYTIYKWDL